MAGARAGLWWRRWPVLAILVVVVVARLAIAFHLRADWLTTGQPAYDRIAQHVERGVGFSIDGRTPSAETPPVYPLLLAGLYEVLGRHWWSLALLQTLFDVGSALLLVVLGTRLFSRRVGVAAAAVFAVYPYLASQSAQLMDTSLFTLCLLGFLAVSLRLAESGTRLDAVLVGVVAAVGFLVRPTIAVVAVLLPALLALRGMGRRRLWAAVAVAAAAAVIAIVPWTVRNAVAFHTFVPGAAKGGTNFWIGNSPHTAEYVSSGRSLDLLLRQPDTPKPPSGLNPARQDTWYLRRGLAWVREHPGAWLHTLRVKFEAFWSWHLNPKTIGTTHAKEVVYTATYGPVLVFALLSLFLIGVAERRRQILYLWLPIATYAAANVLIVGYSRVRAPLDALLIVLDAALVAGVLSHRQTRPLLRQP